MDIPAHIVPFWETFIRGKAEDPTPRFFDAFHFDDNEQSANELALLVLSGSMRATAGLVWSFEAASLPAYWTVPRSKDACHLRALRSHISRPGEICRLTP